VSAFEDEQRLLSRVRAIHFESTRGGMNDKPWLWWLRARRSAVLEWTGTRGVVRNGDHTAVLNHARSIGGPTARRADCQYSTKAGVGDVRLTCPDGVGFTPAASTSGKDEGSVDPRPLGAAVAKRHACANISDYRPVQLWVQRDFVDPSRADDSRDEWFVFRRGVRPGALVTTVGAGRAPAAAR
jgi:hypothetical protein